MPFVGTIINFAAVLIFSILGALLGRKIPHRVNGAVFIPLILVPRLELFA